MVGDNINWKIKPLIKKWNFLQPPIPEENAYLFCTLKFMPTQCISPTFEWFPLPKLFECSYFSDMIMKIPFQNPPTQTRVRKYNFCTWVATMAFSFPYWHQNIQLWSRKYDLLIVEKLENWWHYQFSRDPTSPYIKWHLFYE